MLINPNTATLSHRLCGLSAAQILLGLGGGRSSRAGDGGVLSLSARCHLTPRWQCPSALPASPYQQSSAFGRQLKANPHLQRKAAGWIWGQRALQSGWGGGRYAFITLQSLCGGRAPRDAALKRAFVPFPRFSKLLFAWLFICIKAEGGGVKISFSCQAQRFPFRVFPLPPPPPPKTHSILSPSPPRTPPRLPPPAPFLSPLLTLSPGGGVPRGGGDPASCTAT